MVSWSPVISTLTINLVQAVIFYLIFEIFRRKPHLKRVFSPRHLVNPHRTPTSMLEGKAQGLFRWIPAALRVSNEETLRCGGLDAYIFLRFLRFGLLLTGVTLPLALGVLVPTYATGGNDRNDTDTDGYNQITMANVKNSSERLWASLGFFIIFVVVALRLLWLEWEHFLPLRLRFIAAGDEDASVEFRYAVRVENVPEQYRSDAALFKLFDHLFPKQVKSAIMCVNIKEMDGKMKERTKAILAIEAATAKKAFKPNKGEPTTKIGGKACIGGQKVEVIAHYTSELERLNGELDAEHTMLMNFLTKLNNTAICAPEASDATQSKADLVTSNLRGLVGRSSVVPSPSDPEIVDKWQEHLSSSGFVLFNTLASKQAALQMELDGKANSMEAFPAAEIRDTVWDNITMPRPQQQTNLFTANILWVFGILFWTFPVLGVQFIANLETLDKQFGLWVPDQSSPLYGILAGYLPVIGMIVLLTIVPLAIQASALKFIKIKSASEADMYTFKWHFGFQVANLWIVLIGGSLFNQLSDLLDEPGDALNFIAAAIPGASQFFMNLVITQTFSGLFLEMSGLVNIIVSSLMGQLKKEEAKTLRQLKAEVVAPFLKWGWVVPPMILIVFVTFAYSAIVPLMELFSFLFFLLAYVLFKFQILNKFVSKAEGGGLIWLTLFDMIMGCLYMSEFIFLAYLGIKESVMQSPVVIIVIVVTAFVHMKINAAFRSQCLVAPLLLVRDIDCEAAGEEVLEEHEGNETEKDGGEAQHTPEVIDANIIEPPTGSPEEMEKYLNEHTYAQPSLRKQFWETEPLPYRED